jgi:hypothetical protein
MQRCKKITDLRRHFVFNAQLIKPGFKKYRALPLKKPLVHSETAKGNKRKPFRLDCKF